MPPLWVSVGQGRGQGTVPRLGLARPEHSQAEAQSVEAK